MREIKFRAWHKQKKIMLNLIAINFSLNQITADIEASKIYPERHYWWKETNIPFSEIELMQYTGLKDKNGKEIYEGDILKGDDGEIFYNAVIFDKERAIFVRSDSIELWENVEELEVIGNIYENKELLND